MEIDVLLIANDDGAGVIAVELILILLDGVTVGVNVAVVVTITVKLSVGVIEIVVAPDEKKDELVLDSMIIDVAEDIAAAAVVVSLLSSKYDLVAMIGTMVAVKLPVKKDLF